ncbi:MAG: hypothetical protein ACI85O_001429 [Saprospiraceae bacterium]|jgi:hypothetical protein
MESNLSFTNFWTHPRFWRHFWPWFVFLALLVLMLTASAIGNPGEEPLVGIGRILKFIFGIFILTYASFFAYNKLKPQKKYLLLSLAFVIIIFVVAFLNDRYGINGIMMGELRGFWANVVIYPFILMVAFGFKLAYHSARHLLVIERLKTKQTESELKLLKSQVNPHFLFNTLNNIYATNLDDHEKANEIILELADLLRYQLQSQSKPMMPLSEEISILENYISLEKIRVKDCKVNLQKEGDFDRVTIVPLLLLPFVENAFKYGTGIEEGNIDLKFHLNEANVFTFYCQNKIVQKKGKVHSGGIGLENVKKRLALRYANDYKLDIDTENDYFTVQLEIRNLDKN